MSFIQDFLQKIKKQPSLADLPKQLVLVHDLSLKDFKNSMQFLHNFYGDSDLLTVHIDELEQLEPKAHYEIFTTHLNLKQEISQHQKVSAWAFDNNLDELNSYNKLAKVFDDKYLFYVLMLAGGFRQPFTVSLLRKDSFVPGEELDRLNQLDTMVLKPRHGTENIDVIKLDYSGFDLEHPELKKIQAYDDCLVQEYIDFDKEFSVLFFKGNYFANVDIVSEDLQELLCTFNKTILDYAKRNHISEPQVYSLDILSQGSEFIILEANIRPAALNRFCYKLNQLRH